MYLKDKYFQLKYIKTLYFSFLDKSAKIKTAEIKFRDVWTAFILVASTLTTMIVNSAGAAKVFSWEFYSSFIPLAILIIGVIWSVHIICATEILEKTNSYGNEGLKKDIYYKYNKAVRTFSKLLFPILLLLLPFTFTDLVGDITPLPQPIIGRIHYADGDIVKNAKIRILSVSGLDITKDSPQTDELGIFGANAVKKIYRNAKLLIFTDDCAKPDTLLLLPDFKRLYYSDLQTTIYSYSSTKKCVNR